jgi:predicted DNA-binding protein (MmcQ/YjbR family)
MVKKKKKRHGARGTAKARGGELRERVTAICVGLPGTDVTQQGDHATYRVRGKVFAYFLDDHHGDGIVSVCVKSELGENLDRVRLDPERYYLPAYIGPRGWFGIRVDRGRVAWREVAQLLERSYRLTAPKAQLLELDARDPDEAGQGRLAAARRAVR